VYAVPVGKWSDELGARGILFPISVMTLKPGVVSIQQGGGGASGGHSGPVSFVLDGLPSTVTLTNGAGITRCAPLVGSPFVRFNNGTDPALGRGQLVTVPLDFVASSPTISYTPRVLAGV
jgi:hypothetical protein